MPREGAVGLSLLGSVRKLLKDSGWREWQLRRAATFATLPTTSVLAFSGSFLSLSNLREFSFEFMSSKQFCIPPVRSECIQFIVVLQVA